MSLRSPSSRLALVMASNGLLRVAGGASTVLAGVYIADLAERGLPLGAGLAGSLAAMAYGAELVGAVPLGMLSDAVSARVLMTGGALLAAFGIYLFGATSQPGVLLLSRALEGLAVAAGVPPLLAHVTDRTAHDPTLRARAMSYFELSLLAGLALGGVVGARLWSPLGTHAFTVLALVYTLAAVVLWIGGAGPARHPGADVWQGLQRALASPALQRLAPIWICMNAIVGVWLGPTLYFLLSYPRVDTQLLTGLSAGDPSGLGWLLFTYALVFAAGVLVWSRVLPRIDVRYALQISLLAMLGVSFGLLLLNHMTGAGLLARWTLTAVLAVLVMVESGFTPAALSLLAAAVGPAVGRGAAMGIYSLLLSAGALAGTALAGIMGRWLAIDGLIVATFGLTLLALALLPRLPTLSAAAEHR